MQVCKPCHYNLVEGVEFFKLLLKAFEHLLTLWMGTWLHTLTVTTTDASPDGESWLKSYLMQVCKPCHSFLIEAVEPFKLHPMSMPYLYESFKHLLRLWMVIWLHIHIITSTDTSPDLWELDEILPDASVQTMPLQFCWCCRTLQTASYVHIIHIWGVWASSQVVDGHMASHLYHFRQRCFPKYVRVGWNPTWCKCADHATSRL